MNAIINGALALTVATVAVWSWTRARRALAVFFGLVAAGWACVAVRNLPDHVIVAGLLAVAGVVAVATVWPLLRPGRRVWSASTRGRGEQ